MWKTDRKERVKGKFCTARSTGIDNQLRCYYNCTNLVGITTSRLLSKVRKVLRSVTCNSALPLISSGIFDLHGEICYFSLRDSNARHERLAMF